MIFARSTIINLKIQLVMASLQDYGIRFISHGEWSDPEIEWKKSKFQTLLFNYWDVAECTDYDTLCDSTKKEDLEELCNQLWDLEPEEYVYPNTYYEWVINGENIHDLYDNNDYLKEVGQKNNDFISHTTGQALRQALSQVEDLYERSCTILIFRREGHEQTLVAKYRLEGSVLKDIMSYKKN